MRILFVSYLIYPCDTGGTEVFNYHLADRLSQQNDVTLWTYCDTSPDNTELKSVRKHRPERYISALKLFFYILRNRKNLDVIFLSYMRSHWFWWSLLPIIKMLTGIEYVITIHGGGLTPWKPFFLYRWSFVNAFKLIGISKRICAEYEKRTGLEVEYIPPLFPFIRSERNRNEIKNELGLPENSTVILSVGSLKELKSPFTILEAFQALKPEIIENHDLHLVFAGEGPLKTELIDLAEYPERTLFLGNIPREKMPDLFKTADLYVIASEYEGTPLSLLEAVFNRVPVIGSDVGGVNAIIENKKNGLLFEFGNDRELSSYIRRLIENGNLSRHYSEEAQKTYSERYSYDKVLGRYQRIFIEAAHE